MGTCKAWFVLAYMKSIPTPASFAATEIVKPDPDSRILILMMHDDSTLWRTVQHSGAEWLSALLVTQSFDGVELGGLHGGPDTEDQPDADADDDAYGGGPHGHAAGPLQTDTKEHN
jgi:hypothetical protein